MNSGGAPHTPGRQERLPSGQLAPLVLDHDGVLMTVAFSVDTLPDLWRYVSSLSRRMSEERSGVGAVHLVWELDTLAGRFVLFFVSGELVDVMHHPVRPVGAKGGKRALGTLFRQLGGRSVVSAVPGPPPRHAVFDSCEQLLIEMATLEDEAVAPAILAGVTYDVTDELEAVKGVAVSEYPTWFRVLSSVSPLTDVLQVVAGFKVAYVVDVSPGSLRSWVWGAVPPAAFRFVVRDGVVLAAWSVREGWQGGQSVFSSLVSSRRPVFLLVSLWDEGAPWAEAEPLGKLDVLLMREVLSGRFMSDVPGGVDGGASVFDSPVFAAEGPVQSEVVVPVVADGPSAVAPVTGAVGAGVRRWMKRLAVVVFGGRFGSG